ncbi:MAG: B12-binding domain-containing radical SAM protein [Proteobacteria bacterium]|nr:MAG: B12-binding domain-containing radical SAM protein [Pseudomonadota bacterium]
MDKQIAPQGHPRPNTEITPAALEAAVERLLPRVQKPARYVGGELNEIRKDWDATPLRVALAFPDIYDIGMANSALMLLYEIVNSQDEMLAERVYLPWVDMQQELRDAGLPLYALESKRPLSAFDLIGVSLPYETLYTNALALLELGGVSLRAAERGRDQPVVLGGGHATFNPEPVWPFLDAFVIGEGEEAILESARCVRSWREDPSEPPREALWRELATIQGIYTPGLYRAEHGDDGRLIAVTRVVDSAPLTVVKRIVTRLPPPMTNFIVPHIETVHDRATVEIMRGCTRGCRFCHAGMVTRPVRERGVDEIVDSLEQALDRTGFSEVGLLSLSSSDYTPVLELVNAVRERFKGQQLNISLPSLRIESFSIELMEALSGAARRSGFTLAPEAASERMRELINKPVSTRQVLDTARDVFERGWHTIKLYFMIGHPAEQLEDVEAIAELCHGVLQQGRQAIGRRAKVNVGVSTFVPKPHTPFQWAPTDTPESIVDKQRLLRGRLRDRAFKLSWTDPRETMLEARLSRGDRRIADVIERAYRLGARFDAWQEHFDAELWDQAFADCGIDPTFYTHRERGADEPLPWDHIDVSVDRRFLRRDYEEALEGKTKVDCRERCYGCGLLRRFNTEWKADGDAWQCPQPGAKSATRWGEAKELVS